MYWPAQVFLSLLTVLISPMAVKLTSVTAQRYEAYQNTEAPFINL